MKTDVSKYIDLTLEKGVSHAILQGGEIYKIIKRIEKGSDVFLLVQKFGGDPDILISEKAKGWDAVLIDRGWYVIMHDIMGNIKGYERMPEEFGRNIRKDDLYL